MAAPFVLSESSCVTTLAAEFFRGLSATETVTDGLDSGFCQNFFHILCKQVAQGNVTLVIQAAGDYRSVAQDTDLILQTVAEYLIAAVIGGKIRPVELVAVFQEDPIADGCTFFGFLPGLGKVVFHFPEDSGVLFVGTALIPQAVNHQFLALRGLAEGEAVLQIFFEGNSQVVGLKGVEGDIDLVQGRGAQEHFLLLLQQRAVGGEDYPESVFTGKNQKPLQIGVAQRLTHQMEVEKIGVRLQFRQQSREFFFRHNLGFALRSGTEAALQIADIGDFQINFVESFHNAPVQ